MCISCNGQVVALCGFVTEYLAMYFTTKVDSYVGEIVLNKPDKLNVISVPWANELASHVKHMEESDNVRVILVWAEGKMFTAGLDLNALQSIKSLDTSVSKAVENLRIWKFVKEFQAPITAVANCKKPVIAAVHGRCIGGGVDLITACDIRFCTKDALFSVAETQMGIVADLGTIPRLTKIIGKGLYNEMIFTGEPLGADRAAQSGLVNRVFEDKSIMLKEARLFCQKIAANSPLIVQSAKRILRLAENMRTEDALDYLAVWNTAFLESDDLLAAVSGFMQKKPPTFINKL